MEIQNQSLTLDYGLARPGWKGDEFFIGCLVDLMVNEEWSLAGYCLGILNHVQMKKVKLVLEIYASYVPKDIHKYLLILIIQYFKLLLLLKCY